jgi:hypothetical protein
MRPSGRVGTVVALLALSCLLGSLVIVAATLVSYAANDRAPGGDPWLEYLLSPIVVAPAIVFGGSALSQFARPGVKTAAVVVAVFAGGLAFVQFRAITIVGIPDGLRFLVAPTSTGTVTRNVGRIAVGVAPLVVGLVHLRRRGVERGRIHALGAVGASLFAMALALPRIAAPSPSQYLGTLLPVPFENAHGFHFAGNDYHIEHVAPAPVQAPYQAIGDDGGGGCVLRGPHGTLPLGNLLYAKDECRLGWEPSSSGADLPSGLYVDPRGDYAVLYQPQKSGPYMTSTSAYLDHHRGAPRLCEGCVTSALALRADGARVVLDTKTLSDRLGAPTGMLVLTALGSAIALWLVVVAGRLRKKAFAVKGCEALYQGAGSVLVGDDLVHIAAARGLPTGPVVLFGGTDDSPTAYRDRRMWSHAEPGTLANLRDQGCSHAVTLEIAAFAVALVTAAPLLGAHVAGL